MRRAFVVVIDACGAGELPDAADYGDAGSNTLKHLAEAVGGLRLPTLQRLGLGSITEIAGVAPAADPAVHGRIGAQGPGKESVTGHWELMGAIPTTRLPTYPEGFPPDVVAELERVTGHTFLCNRPYNGIAVIEAFAEEHLRTGSLILYTSQDSVLQLAAHTSVLSEAELVDVCRAAREVMRGEHAAGRVIARPFDGGAGTLAAHGGPQGPVAHAAVAVLPRRADGRGHPGPRGRQDPRPLRGRRDHREPSGSDERHRAGVDLSADRRHGARPGVHEPRRDRPGVRAPQGRRGLRQGAGGDRRDRRRRGSPG